MDQKQESYSSLKEYEKQIKDEHNEQLIRYLAQVFLSDEKHLSDFEIIVNGNKHLTHKFIISLFIPYLLTKCPKNCIGLQIEGIESFSLEIILNYCYTGKLEPNENNFFQVLETATQLYMNQFVAKWCQCYEQKIKDPITKLMHKRRIAVMFGWIDEINQINESLNRMTTIGIIDKPQEISEREIFEKPISESIKSEEKTPKQMSKPISLKTSFIPMKGIVSTNIDEQIQKNLDLFMEQNKAPKESSKSRPKENLIIDAPNDEYEENDEEYEKALESFRKSHEEEEEIEKEEEVEAVKKVEEIKTIAKPIARVLSDSKIETNFIYLFGEVFSSSEDQYVYQRDFKTYIYKTKDVNEWQLYRKFDNHFRTSFTCFVNYKSDILLIGALIKVPEPKNKTQHIANRYCMRYIGGSQFKTFPDMVYSRARHAVAVVNDVLYAIGGIKKLEPNLESVSVKLTINKSIEYYDESGSKWIVLPESLPVRIYSMAALQFNNQLWIIGGMTQNENKKLVPINDIYAYDPKNREMIRIKYKLPNACAFMSAIEVDNKLFVIGGKILTNENDSESLEITNNVWIFDSNAKEWTEGPPLNHPRCKTSVIKRGPIIYAFGGAIDSTHRKCSIVEKLNTDNLNEGWIRHQNLPIHVSGYKIVIGKSYYS